jgi:hypothetical protein
VLLTDGVITAAAGLFDGGGGITHPDLGDLFRRAGVAELDPAAEAGSKKRRVQAVLMAVAQTDKERPVLQAILDKMRAAGYLEEGSLHALRREMRLAGWSLDDDAQISHQLHLDSEPSLRRGIAEIRRRVNSNPHDAPLLVGSAKDMVESASRIVLTETGQGVSTGEGFEKLLGRALAALGLDHEGTDAAEIRQLFESAKKTGMALNRLRNEFGTGHGRESRPELPEHVARYAIRAGLNLADLLVEALEQRQNTD